MGKPWSIGLANWYWTNGYFNFWVLTGSGSEARQRNRAGRSNFGVMKDGAKKEVKKLKKTGFATIRERMEIIHSSCTTVASRSSPRHAAISCIAWAAASPQMWAGPLRHDGKARGQMWRHAWCLCHCPAETPQSRWMRSHRPYKY